jgi:hypothetical protein
MASVANNNQQRKATQMTTPTIIEVDCSTGVSTERPLTAEEIANMEAIQADNAARQAAAEAEATAKAAAKAAAHEKLAALGLSAAEIAAL